MKRLICAITLLALASPALSETTERKPEELTMTLAWIADAGEPKQYIFVINGVVAYKTVDGLKKYLADLPEESTLTWAPGCWRMGDEPLRSQEELRDFKEFCRSEGIMFVLVPSG